VLTSGEFKVANILRDLKGFIQSPLRPVLSTLASPRAARLIGEPLLNIMGVRPRFGGADLSRVKRALVVRPDGIGDVVMTTPFLRELRRNLPHAWIVLAVGPPAYNLVKPCPYVDEVLVYNPNVRGRLRRLRRHWRAFCFARKHLWRRHFDLAIVPRWDTDNYSAAFVAYFSGAPWRVGYSENVTERKKLTNTDYDCLFTHTINSNALEHEVQHNLHVIRFLGGRVEQDRPELWLRRNEEVYAEAILADCGVKPGALVIAVGPSPGGSRLKAWPVENFIEVVRWLTRDMGAHVLLTGAAEECDIGAEIEQAVGSGVVNTMGRTTLRQAAALMRRCALYIGNDTGATHMAAAIGTPTVALFGPSCPHRFAPFGEAHTVVWSNPACGPCLAHGHADSCLECPSARPRCMLDISVDRVKQIIRRSLETREDCLPVQRDAGNPPLTRESLVRASSGMAEQ
jgi:heptosyltransferase-2